MRRFLMTGVLVLAILGVVSACRATAGDDSLPPFQRFVACQNRVGSGFFWVDTTSGQAWWVEIGKMRWINYGKPEGAMPGPNGTYMPVENKSGGGVFVMNTVTGEGWYTNGKEWKRLGIPKDSPGYVEYQEGK